MKINKTEILYILTLILIAFGLRSYDILNFPWGLHVDEVDKILMSISADWKHPPAFFYGWKSGGRNPIYIYLIKFSREILFGNSIFAIRIIPVTIGTLTVLFYYLFNKQLFKNSKLAFLISLPLCFALTHNTFSRLSLQTILVPFFIMLIANFYIAFINSKNKRFLYFYSIFLGLGLYSYYSFLAVIPIGVLLLLFLLYKKRLNFKLFFILCLIILLVISPMLKFWSNKENRNEYFRRSQGISITNPIWHHNSEKWFIKTIFYNAYVVVNKITINSYTDERNNYRYQIPFKGMVDPFILILFITFLYLYIKSKYQTKEKLEKLILGISILIASTLGAIITVELRGYTVRLLPTFTFIFLTLSFLIYFVQQNYKIKYLNKILFLTVCLSILFNFYSIFFTLKTQWATHERFDEDYYNLGLILKKRLENNQNLVIYMPDGDERYKNILYTNFGRKIIVRIDQYKVFNKIPETNVDKIMVIRESDFNKKVNKYSLFKNRFSQVQIIPKLRSYGFIIIEFR
ncbi:MAG: glycosyltransferase family 39 protein [bacterium]|nr:glycosyltransferase family 39 protein [bacterium]